jgi:TonB family protein
MRRTPLVLAALLLSFSCTQKSKPGSDDQGVEDGDQDPGQHSLEWRTDDDGVTTSPVSLTASDGTGLQLVSVDARAVLEDPLAFTELTLVFRNPEDRVREGRFEINLPPGAAISRFSMKIGDEWQEAEVVERQAARRAYEDFLHRKQDPALLEKKAGNQFRARVFPIPANATKEIKVSYSQEMKNSKEPYRVMLRGLPRLAALNVDVAIVKSATAGMSSSMGGKASAVEHLAIVEKDVAPRADLEVRVENTITRRGLRHDNLAVGRIAPAMDLPEQPISGLTVLFDTSASRALGFEGQVERFGELVASLSAKGEFELQVLCFDQTIEQVYSGPATGFGTDARKRILARHALGASDLAHALGYLHTAKKVEDRVLLVSDGILTAGEDEHDELRKAVAQLEARGVKRLDALVDGGIQDEILLEEVTTAGLESAGIVASARLTQDTLVDKLTHATRSGIKVSVPGAAWVWPQVLDGMQPGDEVLVYADLPKGQPMNVHLETEGAEAQDVFVPLRPAEGKLLERAWTQASIARMTGNMKALPADDTDAKDRLKKEIIEVSTKKRVLSDYTALLVLETDADYARFNIDRTALTDILTVGSGGIELMDRSKPKPSIAVDEREEAKMERNFDPDMVARQQGILELMQQESGHFLATPPGGAFAAGEDDEDVWGGLTGSEIGEAYGEGGLGLVGTGRGGGGAGEGDMGVPAEDAERESTIGLGTDGLIGRGGGGGTGSGYGRGSGAGFGGRGRRVPRVRVATPTVSGGLDRNIIRRITRAHINEVRHCYNQGLTRNPELEGRVTVDFTINAEGRVTQSSVQDTSLSDERVGTCITRAVKRWKFPKPQGGGFVTVRYPFNLSPGSVSPSYGSGASSPPPASPNIEKPKQQDAWTGRFAEIMELLAKGEKKLALDTAWQWRESEPGSELALLGLGEAAEANEDWELAARVYGSLIDLFPSRADIRRMAGQRLERLAQNEGAPGLDLVIDTYAHAAEQRADHPSSHRLYAYALVKAGRHEDAFDAIVAGASRDYPGGRFAGVPQILREDVGLIGAAWLAANPKDETRIRQAVSKAGSSLANQPSTRFVLNWETDANDVDFHIFDARGGHASYRSKHLGSGGDLYADVTTGYGPECFNITGKPTAFPYVLQGHYYSMGPMGYGMGKLQIIQHDGNGRLTFQEEPFVIMKDQAYVNLGELNEPL